MDTGDESFVDVAGTIGGQLFALLGDLLDRQRKGEGETDEEDAIKVFELAEEDGDEGVALYVLDVPLLEKNVCFVKEEYSLPGDGVLEHLFELDL